MTEKQAALITGASGGIGLELAKLFARDGHELVLVARSEDKLRALAEQLGVRATVLAFDLSRPEAPKQLFEQLGERNIELGYLVNNAGFGTVGNFWELDRARELEMIAVSYTHLTLPTILLV